MSVTYTWEVTHIQTVDIPNNPNTIVQIMWRKIGTDEANNVGIYEGSTKYNPDSIVIALGTGSGFKFTEFSKLKEKTLLNWIQKNISPADNDIINEEIDKKISMNKYEKKVVDLPWIKK